MAGDHEGGRRTDGVTTQIACDHGLTVLARASPRMATGRRFSIPSRHRLKDGKSRSGSLNRGWPEVKRQIGQARAACPVFSAGDECEAVFPH
jgi:hypothetical protein